MEAKVKAADRIVALAVMKILNFQAVAQGYDAIYDTINQHNV